MQKIRSREGETPPQVLLVLHLRTCLFSQILRVITEG